MNNKSIVLLLPYFGHFPNYFNLWLKSAGKNKTVNFVILTDHPEEVQSDYENIKIVNLYFQEVQDRIHELLGKGAKIQDPYKLCEYKPAYGELFPELIKDFDFWGFCDPDLIWGDIRKFVTNEVLNEFDKVYFLGHLTIYRNNQYMNTLYRSYSSNDLPKDVLDYELAFSTKHVKQFSELAGTSAWYPYVGVKTYSKIDFADVDYRKFNFESTYLDLEEVERYYWDNGKTFRQFKNGNTEEVIYVHLQKRKMNFSNEFHCNSDYSIFYISPNLFSLYEQKDFWKINENEANTYELNTKKRERKKKINKIFSLDFLFYKLKLKLEKKNIPKYPSSVFIDKYYR